MHRIKCVMYGALHACWSFSTYIYSVQYVNYLLPSQSVLTLFDDFHIVLNCIANFVYSPLNSYYYIHWILDFKYILLLLHGNTKVGPKAQANLKNIITLLYEMNHGDVSHYKKD